MPRLSLGWCALLLAPALFACEGAIGDRPGGERPSADDAGELEADSGDGVAADAAMTAGDAGMMTPRDAAPPADAAPAADAAPPPDAGPANAVPSEMRPLFDLMNAARAATNSPPFVWNAGVAASADGWAANCDWMHAPANQRVFNGTQLGENLGAGSGGSWTPQALGQGWIDERTDYDCAANTCAANAVCGHYTQVIWRASTEVGCAIRTCTTGSPFGAGSWRFLVCRYLPAGNFVGRRPIPAADCP